MKAILPTGRSDRYGNGGYGARRTKADKNGSVTEGREIVYSHTGEDQPCYPNTTILPEKAGEVLKIGYCYGDDLSFRYIEIADDHGMFARYMYVAPLVMVGDRVELGEIIGRSQKLGDRYPGITEHVHFEAFERINGKKVFFDPATYYLRR